jgi:hypothetical protein
MTAKQTGGKNTISPCPRVQRLRLKHDGLISGFTFCFKLRPSGEVKEDGMTEQLDATEAARDGLIALARAAAGLLLIVGREGRIIPLEFPIIPVLYSRAFCL